MQNHNNHNNNNNNNGNNNFYFHTIVLLSFKKLNSLWGPAQIKLNHNRTNSNVGFWCREKHTASCMFVLIINGKEGSPLKFFPITLQMNLNVRAMLKINVIHEVRLLMKPCMYVCMYVTYL